jgi:PAS domain S-box-containing protein
LTFSPQLIFFCCERVAHTPVFGLSLLVVLLMIGGGMMIWRNAVFLNQLDHARQVEGVERQRAEAAHHESESLNRMLMESSADCIQVLDLEGRLLLMNHPGQNLLEIEDLHPLIGCLWTQFWQGPDQSVALDAFAAAKSGVMGRFLGFCPTAKGLPKWWDVIVTPILDPQGKPRQLLSIARDITERKLSELALRDSEARLHLALDAAQLGTWRWDLSTDLETRDANLNRLFGLPPQVTHHSQDDFLSRVHPDDRPRLIRLFQQAKLSRSAFALEYRIIWPDGSIHWVLDQGKVICNELGEPSHLTGVSMDITDRKQAAQQQEQILIREQQARTIAETGNRIKDEFLSVLSHELRTPLNPILAWSQILQRRSYSRDDFQYGLEVIERNAKRQVQLVEDLLDVSQLLQGKVVLDVTPVELTTVISGALETIKLATEAKQIQISTQIAYGVGFVLGDSDRLQQIVQNLLTNAVKFTPEKGRIDIRLTRSGAFAQLEVQDNGQGISVEFLPYMFDYFRQADSSNTRHFGGLGLGLAIVRRLTELHGGTIQAASPGCGRGATFTLRIPLAPVAIPAAVKH